MRGPAVVPLASAVRHLLRRGRRGDGLLRRGAVVREGPRAVQPADRGLPARAAASSSTWSRRSRRRSSCAGAWAASRKPDKLTPAQISLAKRNCVSMARDIARDARDILGANGVTDEYQCGRHMLNLESGLHVRGHARHPHARRRPGRHGPRGVRRLTWHPYREPAASAARTRCPDLRRPRSVRWCGPDRGHSRRRRARRPAVRRRHGADRAKHDGRRRLASVRSGRRRSPARVPADGHRGQRAIKIGMIGSTPTRDARSQTRCI